MAKSRTGYFGLDYLISLIIAIIPFTAWVCGIVERFLRGNLIGAILNIPFGFIFWVIDLVSMILKKDLVILA